MKKLLAALLVFALLIPSLALATSPAPSPDYAFVDAMSMDEITALRDYLNDKLAAAKAAPVSTDEAAEVEASREEPALVGDRVLVDQSDYTIAITVENIFRGEPANAIVKSFARYNGHEKGKEWVLMYLKIEAVESETDRIGLSDYYLHIVSDSGIDQGSSYISDNPSQVSDMYVGAIQYCWYGLEVAEGTKVFLTFDDGYSSDSTWFDLSARRQVDTTAAAYPEIKKNDTGDAVQALQFMLAEYGFFAKAPSLVFDSATIKAVKAFQKAAGVATTGLADEATQRLLFSGAPVVSK